MLRNNLWHYIKSYKFNSLLVKNFVLILFVVVLPLLGLSLVIYSNNRSILEEEIIAANESSLMRVRDTVDMIMMEADRVGIHIATDGDVESFFEHTRNIKPDYKSIQLANEVLKTISMVGGEYFKSVYVYSKKNDYIIDSRSGGSLKTYFYDAEIIDDYIHERNDDKWVTSRIIKDYARSKLYLLSVVFGSPLNYKAKKGVVVVNIDILQLKKLISNVNTNRDEQLYIIDENDHIIFCGNEDIIGKKTNSIPQLDQILEHDNYNNSIKKNQPFNRVITNVKSNYNKWKYVSIIPLKIYEQKMQYMKNYIVVAIVISIIIAVIVSFLLSIRVFMPIKNIMMMLDKPENYFDYSDKDRINNELKYIASNILNSFDESRLREEELAMRINMLKKAKAMALQSQINPHFLYNTLQTVNWLVMGLTKGENQASEVIVSLSHILRATMETETYLVPIRDEINYAKEYLEIQKVRYKDKFNVVWDVEDSILDNMITQITLQPILENSIYHGIKPLTQKGLITVKGNCTNDFIEFYVIDNGIGMSLENANELNEELKKEYIKGDQHIGIRNVNQRLKLIFGESYGVEILWDYSRGLKVKIKIPKINISEPL